MPYATHPVFAAPDDPQASLWRYMDFAKLVSLLQSGSLHFARADRLGDPFEGSYSAPFHLALETELAQALPPEAVQQATTNFHTATQGMPQRIYVNCWHVNEYESVAMWE